MGEFKLRISTSTNDLDLSTAFYKIHEALLESMSDYDKAINYFKEFYVNNAWSCGSIYFNGRRIVNTLISFCRNFYEERKIEHTITFDAKSKRVEKVNFTGKVNDVYLTFSIEKSGRYSTTEVIVCDSKNNHSQMITDEDCINIASRYNFDDISNSKLDIIANTIKDSPNPANVRELKSLIEEKIKRMFEADIKGYLFVDTLEKLMFNEKIVDSMDFTVKDGKLDLVINWK